MISIISFFFFPLTFLASLQHASPSKTSLLNDSVCLHPLWVPLLPRLTQFSSQFSCPHRDGAGICVPVPGSHRTAETPSLPLPLHAVSQPSCDSAAACLCLQQSASSYCQISSLLKSYLRSSSCHEALQKGSCSLLHCLLTHSISTNSSVLHF